MNWVEKITITACWWLLGVGQLRGTRLAALNTRFKQDQPQPLQSPAPEQVGVTLEQLMPGLKPAPTPTVRLSDQAVARVAHEVNRAYCLATGDSSQPTWADAPPWQRQSAQTGVTFARTNPGAKPSDSHESWLREKTADGWRYGPVKDPDARTHPCFVPYDQLPPEQRVKDYLFLAVVRALS